MLNYKLTQNDGKIAVIETQTEFEIKQFEKRDPARSLMRHLNLGGGFAGFTPTFFTKSMTDYIKKNAVDGV